MTGALLVNPRTRNKGSARVIPLQQLFAHAGGLKANRGGGKKRRHKNRKHTLVANRRGRKHSARKPNRGRGNSGGGMSSAARSKMSLLAQLRPRDRRGRFVRNPLVANRRGRKHNPLVANRRGRKHNPLVANRRGRKHNPYRRNFGLVTTINSSLSRIPLVGGLLVGVVNGIAGTLGGAAAYVPLHFAAKLTAKLPAATRPFTYSLTGLVLGGLVSWLLPKSMPYRREAALMLATAGGAVDAYRKASGTSATLAGEWGEEGGYGETGEWGEEGGYGAMSADDFGDEENVRPGEWANASIRDAEYSGEDLSAEELGMAEYGRKAYRARFWRAPSQGQQQGANNSHPGASEHAGQPGRRWGWLIYWIGYQQFKALAKVDPVRRRQIIQGARHKALVFARNALQTGVTDGDTSMEALEAAGLLAA